MGALVFGGYIRAPDSWKRCEETQPSDLASCDVSFLPEAERPPQEPVEERPREQEPPGLNRVPVGRHRFIGYVIRIILTTMLLFS